MDLRLTVLFVSACVFISSTEASAPPECYQGLAGDRPSYCTSIVGRDTLLNTLLERLLEKELRDYITTPSRPTEERNVEEPAPETREENVEENVRILELLLDLEREHGIKK